MQLQATITEEDIKRIVATRLSAMTGELVEPKDVKFVVKSKNNYRPQEWEEGKMQAFVSKEVAP